MKFSPLRISLIYLAFALVWVATTDSILENMVDDVAMLSTLQTLKGWFYVTFTALGLYFVIKVYERQISQEKNKLEKIDKNLNEALGTLNISAWQYFVDTDSYYASEQHSEFFGLPKDGQINLNDIIGRLHPDDANRFRQNVNRALESGRDLDIEYRICLGITWSGGFGRKAIAFGKMAKLID